MTDADIIEATAFSMDVFLSNRELILLRERALRREPDAIETCRQILSSRRTTDTAARRGPR